MRLRALICAGLLCCLVAFPARAARPGPERGTTFEATTKGSPVATMVGRWHVDGSTARFAFGGAQAAGARTAMRATWTSGFGPRTRSPKITVECNRLSSSVEDKANKWGVEMHIVPKHGLGRGRIAYRTRVSSPELASGEGITAATESFRAQRWRYEVILTADLVTPSEMSGVCTMAAG